MLPDTADLLTDPVCGRGVEANSPFRAIYGGALFAFCGALCKTQFLELPSRYAVIASQLHAPRPARSAPARHRPLADRAAASPLSSVGAVTAAMPSAAQTPLPSSAPPPVAASTPAPTNVHPRAATSPALLDAQAISALGDTHGALSWLIAWRERRFAATCARQMLELHHDVVMRYPLLQGPDLYRRIVAQRVGDDAAAQAVLQHAEQSFAIWPAERALNYRDVVHYLAVSEFVATHRDAHWVYADMKRIVESVIPQGL
jgi:YHS domain-containing protein